MSALGFPPWRGMDAGSMQGVSGFHPGFGKGRMGMYGPA